MLRLEHEWVWDFWLADDGQDHHLFFLVAPRALGDPAQRGRRARIGHAVSDDLRTWVRLPDALGPGAGPGFDDVATWSGSAVRGPDGRWYMYYTGVTAGRRPWLDQRIGLAVSDDLWRWHRHPRPVLTADPRWYETGADPGGHGEEWRDPWVFADPHGDGWHLVLTARSRSGPVDDRGVLGHARSHDLIRWEPQPPLTGPGGGFGHLEVPQVVCVGDRHLLLFSCLRKRFARGRRVHPGGGGVWAANGDSPLGPFDVAGARPVTNNALYSGRLVQDREGHWMLLAYRTYDDRGLFLGEISDPLPVLRDVHGGIVAHGGFGMHTYKSAQV